MSLTFDDWITELENAIKTHIDTYVPTDVQIIINGELPRAFTKPVITINQFDGDRRNTGGMNTVGGGEQGYWEMPSYHVTVNTDESDAYVPNRQYGRNKVAAELITIAFGQQKHQLPIATGGALKAKLKPIGAVGGGGPLGDRRIYQHVSILEIEVIVPFTSVVL